MQQGLKSRREFLKFSAFSIGAVAVGSALVRSVANAQAPAAPAAGAPVMVSESDPMAKTLGYHADGSKVDLKKWTKKAGADGKSQSCATCLLFNSGKPTKDATAVCSLFAGKHVSAKGWCNSWAKNPAVKA